jgi:hypothetical protein
MKNSGKKVTLDALLLVLLNGTNEMGGVIGNLPLVIATMQSDVLGNAFIS